MRTYVNWQVRFSLLINKRFITEFIPDAVENSCQKCTPKLRVLVRKMSNGIKTKLPKEWKDLEALYDPEGKHSSKVDAFLAQTDWAQLCDNVNNEVYCWFGVLVFYWFGPQGVLPQTFLVRLLYRQRLFICSIGPFVQRCCRFEQVLHK